MINIRNIIIALLFTSSIFLISCGAVGDGSESVTGYFGYNSKYQGYTHHAAFRSYQDAEIMATSCCVQELPRCRNNGKSTGGWHK